MRFSPVAKIRLSALQHNVAYLRRCAPGSKILAMLKANAYGHGLVQIAQWFHGTNGITGGVDGFGLARIEEALILRNHGINTRMVLMEGVFNEPDLMQASLHCLDVVIHDAGQVAQITAAQLNQPLTVWLKIDTGMHRLGVSPEQFDALYQTLLASSNVRKPIHFMTHFACADELENPQTSQQIAKFYQLVDGLPGDRTLANSAGLLAWPSAHGDWNRPGLALFGANPLAAEQRSFPLLPVMTMTSKVLAVREVAAGEPVGYGQSWSSPQATRIAVVAMGYGDGYPRHCRTGTPVLINGKRYPLAGRVSMDMLTVDVGQSTVQVGDNVVLWGEGLPVEEIAACANTIPYELLCGTTARVQYDYLA